MPKPLARQPRSTPGTPAITEAEWLVMKALWAAAPRTASDLVADLSGPTGWKPQTIKTLIARLVDKNAVKFVPRGREYLYSPAVAEAEAIRAESGSFLRRFFGGAVAPMLAHFVEEHPLSADEAARLRALLDRAAKPDHAGPPHRRPARGGRA